MTHTYNMRLQFYSTLVTSQSNRVLFEKEVAMCTITQKIQSYRNPLNPGTEPKARNSLKRRRFLPSFTAK